MALVAFTLVTDIVAPRWWIAAQDAGRVASAAELNGAANQVIETRP
jgi:hypothetical protein